MVLGCLHEQNIFFDYLVKAFTFGLVEVNLLYSVILLDIGQSVFIS